MPAPCPHPCPLGRHVATTRVIFGTFGGITRAGFAAVTVPQHDCIFHGNLEIR
jgi:hypothetical protein